MGLKQKGLRCRGCNAAVKLPLCVAAGKENAYILCVECFKKVLETERKRRKKCDI